MKRYFRQHLVLALALAALVPTLSFAQNKLVVAIQPTVASDEMLNKAKPLQQFIGKRLGWQNQSRDLRAEAATPQWWNRLRFGHAHLSFMSAWPAQLAVRLGGAEVALAEIRAGAARQREGRGAALFFLLGCCSRLAVQRPAFIEGQERLLSQSDLDLWIRRADGPHDRNEICYSRAKARKPIPKPISRKSCSAAATASAGRR